MRTERQILTRHKTIARQSPPVARYAPIGAGNVQGGMVATRLIRSREKAIYVVVVQTMGTKTKGMNISGFITIGTPKTIGSLILKMPGTIEKRPTFFKYEDLEKHMRIARPMLVPDPPIQTNH